jgi:hypothetical protein
VPGPEEAGFGPNGREQVCDALVKILRFCAEEFYEVHERSFARNLRRCSFWGVEKCPSGQIVTGLLPKMQAEIRSEEELRSVENGHVSQGVFKRLKHRSGFGRNVWVVRIDSGKSARGCQIRSHFHFR